MRQGKRVRPYWTKSALIAASLTLTAQPFFEAPAMAAGGVVKVGTQGRAQQISLGLNKSIILDLPQDAYDVLVSNPSVADAVTRTSRRIYLFGKQVGQTNIFVFGANGEQIASIDIEIERDVSSLSAQLKRLITDTAGFGTGCKTRGPFRDRR
jgi:pilus assembly protein CpaC